MASPYPRPKRTGAPLCSKGLGRPYTEIPVFDPAERFSDRAQQVLIVERLVQKLTAPAFMACTNVVLSPCPVAGYENNLKLDVGFGQLALEIEAAHPGQPYVENQTSWNVEAFIVQKFFSGGKGFDARFG